jgi:hypothetical protein
MQPGPNCVESVGRWSGEKQRLFHDLCATPDWALGVME